MATKPQPKIIGRMTRINNSLMPSVGVRKQAAANRKTAMAKRTVAKRGTVTEKGAEGPKKSDPRMGKYGSLRSANRPYPAEKRAKELSAAVRIAKKKAAIKKASAEGPKRSVTKKK